MVEFNSSVDSQTVLAFLAGDSTQAKSLAGAAPSSIGIGFPALQAKKNCSPTPPLLCDQFYTCFVTFLWRVFSRLPLSPLSFLFCFAFHRLGRSFLSCPFGFILWTSSNILGQYFYLFLIKIYSILSHNTQEEFYQKYINAIIVKGHKTLQNTHYGEWLERRHRHSILSLEHWTNLRVAKTFKPPISFYLFSDYYSILDYLFNYCYLYYFKQHIILETIMTFVSKVYFCCSLLSLI